MMMTQRYVHFISRNLLERQIRLHRGRSIFIPSTAAVIHTSDSDNPTTTSLITIKTSSLRDSQHKTTIRTLTTNSIAADAKATKSKQREENDDNNTPIIQGTIPMHGKGIKMGQYAQIHRKFTQEDVNLFGRLSGDQNPVHFPPPPPPTTTTTQSTTNNNQQQSSSSPPIVHGILLSSLFSTIFGTLIPGAIYRHQSLKFQHVVHVDQEVVGRVVVTKLRQVQRRGVLCTCDTSVVKKMGNKNDNDIIECNNRDGCEEEEIVCISGDAQVWLPDLQLLVDEM